MGAGILIDYQDGSPALELTANIRCPSFCMTTTQDTGYTSKTVTNYVSGSQLTFIPTNTILSYFEGTQLIPTIHILDSVTFSGSTMTQNTWKNNTDGTQRFWPGSVFQILPIGSGNFGIYIANSTNFLSITDATSVGQCVYYGSLTVNGSASLPGISPFDLSKCIVFAKWGSSSVVVERDGNTIRAFTERNGSDVAANITLKIAIFASGVAPTPGNGITIINAAGNCVFSTLRKPFIYDGSTFTPSFNWQDIGNRMVPLGRYGYSSQTDGGWDYLKYAGLMMNGNQVKCGGAKTQNTWTSDYSYTGTRATNIALPCIPNIYT